MKKLVTAYVLFAALVLFTLPVSAQYQAEVTFDDGNDFTTDATCNNMETSSPVVITLQGDAQRSEMNQGKYGRGAHLPSGAGFILFDNYTFDASFIAHFWVNVDSTEQGVLLGHQGRWALELRGGEAVVMTTDTMGATELLAPSLAWPVESGFHHLTLVVTGLDATPVFTLTMDFENAITMTASGPLATSTGSLAMGQSLTCIIDEVILANNSVATLDAEQDRFNRDPLYCPAGLTCKENSYIVLPRALPYEVPVRFKTVFDPLICSSQTPCPLLFAIQGGGACNNDYTMPSDLIAMAAYGFIIVTIDPYCEGNGKTFVPDSEVSQFVSVKEFVISFGTYANHIASSEYAATGCSHGAEAALIWAMNEEDKPSRSFIRSAGVAGYCPQVAGVLCGKPGGTENLPFDVESYQAERIHTSTDAVGMVNHTITREHEMARSWGVNTEGPICPEQGQQGCMEEGFWGMTYASKRFKTTWQAYESPTAPTGYFVEDQGADCRHCAPPGSVAFECGMCLLAHGRGAMATECPDCLLYTDSSIDPGPEGESCPIESSWYEDPLDNLPDPDAGVPDSGTDAQSDAEPDSGEITPGGSAGCSCRTHGKQPLPLWLPLMLVLGVLLGRRWAVLKR